MPDPKSRLSFLRWTTAASVSATGALAGCAQQNDGTDKPTNEAQLQPPALSFLTRGEFAAVQAMAERIYPSDARAPGARDLHVAEFIDRRLGGAYGWGARMYKQGPFQKAATSGHGWQVARTPRDAYRDALTAIDAYAQVKHNATFAGLDPAVQDSVLSDCEAGTIDGFTILTSKAFFTIFLEHVKQGLFSDPRYGGNADAKGWVALGFPGDPMAYGDQYEKWIDRYDVAYSVKPRGLQ
jgi:gluconate 2-dehydrogenase gamma chain